MANHVPRSSLATNTCAFSIDITAPDDKAPWYDLWQAAVALDGMCARTGRTGKSRFLGEISGTVDCSVPFFFVWLMGIFRK